MRIIVEPGAYEALQVEPQLMPEGELTMVPSPFAICCLSTVSLTGPANTACTAFAWFMVTEQAPLPEQAPVQPVKVEPVEGLAVRVIVACG